MTAQLGKNSLIAIHAALANAWGTEYDISTANTAGAGGQLWPGWGGVQGLPAELGYAAAAGDTYQGRDFLGGIKASAELKTEAMSYVGYEKMLALMFGGSPGVPTTVDTTAMKHVYDFSSDSNNNINCTISQYEGLASGTRKTGRSCRLNTWSLTIPKPGKSVGLDLKFLADTVLLNSATNTQAKHTGMSYVADTVRTRLIQPHHFGGASGYVRMNAASGSGLGASDNIYPTDMKFDGDWQMDATNSLDRAIRAPHPKGQPSAKGELNFEGDEGTDVDPNGVLAALKTEMAARGSAGTHTDYKFEALATAPWLAGAATQYFAFMIQAPRVSLTMSEALINGPGVRNGKLGMKFLTPAAAPTGMTGVTGILRFTLWTTTSINPLQ